MSIFIMIKNWWNRRKIAMKWVELSREMFDEEEKYKYQYGKYMIGDCSDRVKKFVEMMKNDGLKLGHDFWVERGKIYDQNHIRLKVFGYLVDPATRNTNAGFILQYKGKINA